VDEREAGRHFPRRERQVRHALAASSGHDAQVSVPAGEIDVARRERRRKFSGVGTSDRTLDDGNRVVAAVLVKRQHLDAVADDEGSTLAPDCRPRAVESEERGSGVEAAAFGGCDPERPRGPQVGRESGEPGERLA